jgi:DNA-directed RNA polymerase subunit N (RpoN/RPB10)
LGDIFDVFHAECEKAFRAAIAKQSGDTRGVTTTETPDFDIHTWLTANDGMKAGAILDALGLDMVDCCRTHLLTQCQFREQYYKR